MKPALFDQSVNLSSYVPLPEKKNWHTINSDALLAELERMLGVIEPKPTILVVNSRVAQQLNDMRITGEIATIGLEILVNDQMLTYSANGYYLASPFDI